MLKKRESSHKLEKYQILQQLKKKRKLLKFKKNNIQTKECWQCSITDNDIDNIIDNNDNINIKFEQMPCEVHYSCENCLQHCLYLESDYKTLYFKCPLCRKTKMGFPKEVSFEKVDKIAECVVDYNENNSTILPVQSILLPHDALIYQMTPNKRKYIEGVTKMTMEGEYFEDEFFRDYDSNDDEDFVEHDSQDDNESDSEYYDDGDDDDISLESNLSPVIDSFYNSLSNFNGTIEHYVNQQLSSENNLQSSRRGKRKFTPFLGDDSKQLDLLSNFIVITDQNPRWFGPFKNIHCTKDLFNYLLNLKIFPSLEDIKECFVKRKLNYNHHAVFQFMPYKKLKIKFI